MEEYLTEIRNSLIRKQLSKFRLSNHRLAIEVGRHQGVHDPRLRYCTFCDKIAECETHFLINCPIYGHLRAPLFEHIIRVYPTFQYLSDKDKFITVMTNSSSLHLASFIHKSFELRDFLMAKPKRCDQALDRNKRCFASYFISVVIIWYAVYSLRSVIIFALGIFIFLEYSCTLSIISASSSYIVKNK